MTKPRDDVRTATDQARARQPRETMPIHVYVHVAHGFDARQWKEKWKSGELIGINDSSPYGYHRAVDHGVYITFSQDATEGLLAGLTRKAIRIILGFDLVHAWRNRRRILASDVIWTHTESQHFGVAAVLYVLGRRPAGRPRLIAQSVWLFDRWTRMSSVRRRFYRELLSQADVLTVLSPANRDVARKVFPGKRIEFVPFGICSDTMVEPSVRTPDGKIRVLAVGNDRHRDWSTLLAALGNTDSAEVRIVSQRLDPSAVRRHPQADVLTVADNAELLELYRWADVVALPLKPNQHASGITVLQEAVLRGLPVVVSDTGGLRAYFDDRCVAFVEPQNAERLRSTVLELGDDPERRLRLAGAAQSRMGPDGLSSESYVRAHCVLSAELVRSPSSGFHDRAAHGASGTQEDILS